MKNQMLKKVVAGLLSVSMLGVCLTGCTSSDADSEKEAKTEEDAGKSDEKITITIGDQAKYFTYKIAEQKGMFDEEFKDDNIEVKIENFVDGAAELESFSAGALDFAIIGDQPAVSAIANNSPLTIVGAYCSCSKGYALCAAKGSDIKSVKDLRGKKVAATSGTALHQLLLLMLESEGMTIDDVDYYSMQSTEYFPAVESGEIDAVVVTEPQLTTALNEYDMTQICDASDYKTIINVILARNEFLEEHPDLATRMMKVFEKANTWAKENKKEAIEIVANSSDEVTEDVLESIYDTTEFSTVFSDEQVDSLMKTVDFLHDQEVILNKPTLEDLFDDKYLKDAGIM